MLNNNSIQSGIDPFQNCVGKNVLLRDFRFRINSLKTKDLFGVIQENDCKDDPRLLIKFNKPEELDENLLDLHKKYGGLYICKHEVTIIDNK
ncbi:MAG TPA: hypothetical protein VF941_00255 [Clostridia bacterium]